MNNSVSRFKHELSHIMVIFRLSIIKNDLPTFSRGVDRFYKIISKIDQSGHTNIELKDKLFELKKMMLEIPHSGILAKEDGEKILQDLHDIIHIDDHSFATILDGDDDPSYQRID